MKNKAFTLAEVLITLGIIGVIAALTMPALMQSAARAKIGPELSSAMSTLSEATTAFMTDNNADYLPVAMVKAGIADQKCSTFLKYLLDEEYIRGTENTFPSTSRAYSGAGGGLGGGAGMILPNKTGISIKTGDCTFSTVDTECDLIFYTSSFDRAINSQDRDGNKVNKLTTGKEVFKIILTAKGEVKTPKDYENTCGDGIKEASVSGEDCSGRIAAKGWKADY